MARSFGAAFTLIAAPKFLKLLSIVRFFAVPRDRRTLSGKL
jgi:hypothetical protein